jgi:hypothetical protein
MPTTWAPRDLKFGATGNEATPWHTPPGPVFVQVVKGSLTTRTNTAQVQAADVRGGRGLLRSRVGSRPSRRRRSRRGGLLSGLRVPARLRDPRHARHGGKDD